MSPKTLRLSYSLIFLSLLNPQIEYKAENKHVTKQKIIKREAFSHEQEVRLITDLDFDFLPDNNKSNISEEEAEIHKQLISQLHQSGQITEAEMKEAVSQINAEQFKQKTQPRSTKHISFAHVENFIESAMVHPLAPDWYIETVRTFCELNKVPFLGKSLLYTFNPN